MSALSLVESVQARREVVLARSDWTVKRAAWAYGCAKKGSVEEAMLLDVLMSALRREATR